MIFLVIGKQSIDELITLLKSIQNLTFSEPIETEFEWNRENNTVLAKKAKMIKCDLTLTTNDYTDLSNATKTIIELLKSKDFTSSAYNFSESFDGYENASIKVLIKIDAPLNYNPETDEDINIQGEKAKIEIYIGIVN